MDLIINRYFCFMFFFLFRNNSIACLRAKAQEHQARLLNSGLLLQVRSLAGLQNPLSHSSTPPPHTCDSNANTLHSVTGPQSSPHSHSPHGGSPNAISANSIDARTFHHLSHHHSPANLSPAATVKSEHSAGINMAFWYSQPPPPPPANHSQSNQPTYHHHQQPQPTSSTTSTAQLQNHELAKK